MKKELIIIVVAFLFTISFIGCSNEAVKTDTSATTFSERIMEGDENSTVAYMSIEGMSCEVGCAKFINGRLSKTEGVLASEIDFEENLAKVSFDPAVVSAKDLAEMVNKLNDGQYKVSSVEVEQTKKVEGGTGVSAPTSKSNASDRGQDQIEYESFRSISFPNIFNLFKLKLV
jgi:periplasmic mercuric ion binding protein